MDDLGLALLAVVVASAAGFLLSMGLAVALSGAVG